MAERSGQFRDLNAGARSILDADEAEGATITFENADAIELRAHTDRESLRSPRGATFRRVTFEIILTINTAAIRLILTISLAYNVAGLILAAIGSLHPVTAAAIKFASSLTVVALAGSANSLRDGWLRSL